MTENYRDQEQEAGSTVWFDLHVVECESADEDAFQQAVAEYFEEDRTWEFHFARAIHVIGDTPCLWCERPAEGEVLAFSESGYYYSEFRFCAACGKRNGVAPTDGNGFV